MWLLRDILRSASLAGWLLVLNSSNIGSTGSVEAAKSTTTSMPLIPHHVQQNRRLQELREHGDHDGARRLEEHWARQADQRPTTRNLATAAATASIAADEKVSHLLRQSHEDSTTSQYHRREETIQVGGLYHGYGTHYADVWVGTPPQRQTVIVDTGSGVTAFPCSGCSHCGAPTYHIDEYFEQADSSTFQKVECTACQRGTCQKTGGEEQCKINMSYAEGSSWFAFEAQDQTYIGGPHVLALLADYNAATDPVDPLHASHYSFPMTFGCQYRLTGLFEKQLADGIMGMENAKTAFWKQMHTAGVLGAEQQFSLCFSRPPAAKRTGTEAGALTLGGYDDRLHKSPMVYTSNAKGKGGFFGVHVKKAFLRHGDGGESAMSTDPNAKLVDLGVSETDLNRGGVIVDSGTTDTYWTRAISKSFRQVFEELSGKAFTHEKYMVLDDEVASFPTIIFQLTGDVAKNMELYPDPTGVVGLAADIDPDNPYDVLIAVPPSHYLERDMHVGYTARFYDTESSGSVLGANSMMGHDILFDADNMHLGWAESDCDYNRLVTGSGFVDVLDESLNLPGPGESPAESPTTTTTSTVIDQTPLEPEQGDDPQEQEPQAGNDLEDPTNGVDTEAEEKKKPSTGGIDMHDDQSPMDDLVQAANGLADACTSISCRGPILFLVVSVLLICVCCCKCLCSSSKSRKANTYNKAFHRAEVELSTNGTYSDKDDSAYMDDTFDDEDAEFGDFGDKE